MAGESEVEAYVALHQAVFGTNNMTPEWRLRSLRQPDYQPGLDIVAVSPEGRLAAFCIGWVSQVDGRDEWGQIEPLGCLEQYCNVALGRLVLCETLRRMHARGVRKIFVETDNYRSTAMRLYESLGFKVSREILVYRKDYNE